MALAETHVSLNHVPVCGRTNSYDKEPRAMIQLAYFSSISAHLSPIDIERILMTSRENNRQRGITGMLLFDRCNYLQLLEGIRDTVLSLFDVIKEDCRHAGVVKIMQQPIVDRDFPDWAMEFRDLSRVGRDYPAGFREFLEEHFDLGALHPAGAAQLFGLFKKRSDTVATTRT
jgi:Sensors of blue-light using FAD